MKKFAIAIGLLLGMLAVASLFREPLKQAAYDQVTKDMFVTEDTDSFDPGPVIGSRFPAINARWQGRDIRSLVAFYGEHGTVFVATRSAQWCPYCMKQMIQLQEHLASFESAGIAVVAMTYDAPELQQQFVDKWEITYPLLHDVDTQSFRSLGILSESYERGDTAYGIPHPGMIVVDTNGVVVGKLFLEAYSVRVDAPSSLAYAQKTLGIN